MKLVIITGPPYSGKGTQCEILTKELGFKHISTGDRIRLEKEKNSTIGNVMAKFQEGGGLVPDDIMKTLFDEIIQENINSKGIILDGYPRTIPQVKDLIEIVSAKNLDIFSVLNIEVPEPELLKRAIKRAETSDREDDKDPKTHLKRIRVFEELTKPAIEFMKKRFKVNTFDGMGGISQLSIKMLASLIAII